jgi:diguanylate cyclase (GGDEF)-like protein/PAS domain S-box-containing protein
MSHAADSDAQSYLASVRPLGTSSSHRCRPLHVLFIHRESATIDSCLHALKKGQFIVTSDSVSSLALCARHRGSPAHDVIIVEYPSPSIKGPQALQLFLQTVQQSALVFITAGPAAQFLAELSAHGPFEYVERQNISQLPMVVRRALKEKKLRSELEEVEKALRHSQAVFRALVENPTYGVCHCDAQGNFLDVNQAFASMLGYASRDELLAANRDSHIILGLGHSRSLAEVFHGSATFQPVEREWKRKDGTILKASLSGRDVLDEQGNFNGCEIIIVDTTKQRSLEEHLRHQALSDSLTGLANHRRLFDVLHSEIARSQRSGREFSLILLDLDGLKQINDHLGHLAGNRALCRIAQVLNDACRDTDTAARHGGDEFAVVLPETGVASASLVTRRICELLENESEEPHLSVSVGIASYPREADSIGGLLYAADRALYAMKSQKPRAFRAAAGVASHRDAPPEFRQSSVDNTDIRRREAAQE